MSAKGLYEVSSRYGPLQVTSLIVHFLPNFHAPAPTFPRLPHIRHIEALIYDVNQTYQSTASCIIIPNASTIEGLLVPIHFIVDLPPLPRLRHLEIDSYVIPPNIAPQVMDGDQPINGVASTGSMLMTQALSRFANLTSYRFMHRGHGQK
jgi:hypothetical protein